MDKNIHKAAKKFIKAVKYKVDFENAENFITQMGYKIIFFNSPEGDIEITRYRKNEEVKKNSAFTFQGNAKIIFIDNNLSCEDKLYLLLHEIAHILLRHIGDGKTNIYNKILMDIEADALAHEILHFDRYRRISILCTAFVLIIVSLSGLYTQYYIHYKIDNKIYQQDDFDESEPTEPSINLYPDIDDIVYITPTGQKYHRKSCRYAKDKDCTAVMRSEADKNYEPCSVCNP